MTREERLILESVNAELERLGSSRRLKRHRFFPVCRDLECDVGYGVVRVKHRRVSVFIRDNGGPWGRTVDWGTYRGRGWLKALVEAAVERIVAGSRGKHE